MELGPLLGFLLKKIRVLEQLFTTVSRFWICFNGNFKWLHTKACEIFNTSSDLNPFFTKKLFHRSPNLTHRNGNLQIHSRNAIKFGNKSLRSLGTHICGTHFLKTFSKHWELSISQFPRDAAFLQPLKVCHKI